jgi:hypothetical protein
VHLLFINPIELLPDPEKFKSTPFFQIKITSNKESPQLKAEGYNLIKVHLPFINPLQLLVDQGKINW